MNPLVSTRIKEAVNNFSRTISSTNVSLNSTQTNGTLQILPKINSPRDVKALDNKDLPLLCEELRSYLINTLKPIGGHFSGSLGVVELTVALHRIFDSPKDRIVWDIGHQAYIHKILTGRRDALKTIRQPGGISGFCRIRESPHDQFGAGHSSTSIGALQGLYEGDALLNKSQGNCYICVIGDGGMTGGMAYEALNYSTIIKSPLLIIYNDNEQSSLPTGLPAAHGTGPITPFFMKPTATSSCVSLEKAIESLGYKASPQIIGPIDGHDLNALQLILLAIKAKLSTTPSNVDERVHNPIILHLKTIKGKGCPEALQRLDRMHSIRALGSVKSTEKSLTDVFAEEIIALAYKDDKIVAITAGMPGGTGVGKFGTHFPNRTFDVGISEQHAVTFAAGLALAGARPFCCIYSTFLQRGLDQIIHDVALQNAPVKFVIGRAGYVGEDGSSHHGIYDISMLHPLHNLTMMAPSNELELRMMLRQMLGIHDRPCAIRFPKMNSLGEDILIDCFNYTRDEMEHMEQVPIKEVNVKELKARLVKPGSSKIALLGFGTILYDAIKALDMLNIDATIVDMRYMNPLDTSTIDHIAHGHDIIFTVESGGSGGFGSAVMEHVNNANLKSQSKTMIKTIRYPDQFIYHASQSMQNAWAKVDITGIANVIQTTLEGKSDDTGNTITSS